MTRLRVEKVLLGAALVAATMASGRAALASGDGSTHPKKDDKGSGGGASVSVGASVGTSGASADASATTDDSKKTAREERKEERREERKELKEERKEDELAKPFFLGLDMVIGSAVTTTATGVVPPGTTSGILGQTNVNQSRVTSYSFLLDGGLMLTPGFGIGARLPILGGSLYTDPNRAGGAIGNVELGASGELELAKNLELELSLGLALPTAQGNQIPDSAGNIPVVQGSINQSGYDRFSIQHAAAAARGYEDNALFEPAHLGIIPEIKLEWGEHKSWHIDPWVKLENLIATSSNYKFIDELVFGANAGVYATKVFEPGVRLWVNAPLTGADFTTVAVAEPQLRFHIADSARLVVGAILPFAGSSLTSPYDYGFRVSIAGRF